MIKEIITDEEILSQRSEEIDTRKQNNEMRQIIVDLKDTIRAHENCVGLAAIQINQPWRIFVINFNGDLRSFINPVIYEAKGLTLSKESCMSFPGKEYIRPRNNEIRVVYQTPLGKSESIKLVGKAAEVFQHELDHLDGLTIADIGLELPADYDTLSEDDKTKIIKDYMESLDLKQKQVAASIEEDEDAKRLDGAVKFMTAVQKGEIKFDGTASGKRKVEDNTENN